MSSNFEANSYIYSANATYIAQLYEKYIQDNSSVDQTWQDFFSQNDDDLQVILQESKGAAWAKKDLKVINVANNYDISAFDKLEKPQTKNKQVAQEKDLQIRAENLIESYKNYGHFAANLDPLGLTEKKLPQQLSLQFHNINQEDLDQKINYQANQITIANLIDHLNTVYLGNVGAQFNYIDNQEHKNWLSDEFEKTAYVTLNKEQKLKILNEVIKVNGFEQFLHKRFPGAKRFSVEGGDSSINCLEQIIQSAADDNVKKIIFGMAHRGRLNCLTNVMGKPYSQMIAEFQGAPGIPKSLTASGDVKYHMGYANQRTINNKQVNISLAFNPSHLEAVNPVVAGRVRAHQDLNNDQNRHSALAVLVHGDAAFSGQGSVAENLLMNGISGYDTGGIIHIITNNQVGFTADPCDSRSTKYASDLAKSIDAPIFHVNGDDVETVVKLSDLITRFRQKFKSDIVLDIICYRRYGHNEGDEPLYTQPIMYGKIKNHPTLEKLYSNNLINQAVISQEEYQKTANDFNSVLSNAFEEAKKYQAKEGDWLKGNWSNIKNQKDQIADAPITGVKKDQIANFGQKLFEIPEGFKANSKITRQMEVKKAIFSTGENLDWGTAEALAFASILAENKKVRITGQDSQRGTFSHRHSVLTDQNNQNQYCPLSNIGDYDVYNSFLSEYAVLGFEYGYSLSAPNALTIWEGQFGDFANGAQIIIDQFIASSEVKWLRKSNLTMLLPHGYEGQGPEHSSARLERFLQLCGNDNMRVCNITSPANFFHALRRQVHSKDRKPLIVMSPKSLLRHKAAISNLSEIYDNSKFNTIIGESEKLVAGDKVKKVVLCSGKIYYDLLEARQAQDIKDIAIIRLEQIYPFDDKKLASLLKNYPNAQVIWCQEEPKNMGSWHFVNELIEDCLTSIKVKAKRPQYIGRIQCASPATGYASYHAAEQKEIINNALSK